MSDQEIKELEIAVSGFDDVDIQDLDTLRNLRYTKISSKKLSMLVELAKQNNKRALDILVKYYYPFILSIVFNYNIEGLDLNDITMAAVAGFIYGIKKFQKGNISNSVYFYIIKSINKEIGLDFTTAKVGDGYEHIVFLYLKYLRNLRADLTEELTDLELAKKFNIDIKGMKNIIALVNRSNYLDVNIAKEDVKIGDDDYCHFQGLTAIIDKYLPLNYRKIFKMYYGFTEYGHLTQKEIGELTNLSVNRVESILRDSFVILKNTSALKKFREYYDRDYIEPHYRLSKKSIRELKAPIKRVLYIKKICQKN